MSSQKEYTLYCDYKDGCIESFNAAGHKSHVEDMARQIGWTASSDRHKCPIHAYGGP